ncbi:MAG: biopolymer transporter ExbD [Synergistaceae bacterium]|jgi:biopolymer transport protein ExbD|nr:biopolymer transporter ExbD [Synergistaceae bacterium]
MKRNRRAHAEIDITPLIDVLFMLIIFFVLTTAFVQGTMNVDLPIGTPPPLSDKNPVILTVENDSSLLWGGERITRERLPEAVAEAVARSRDILVAGDKSARYGDVAELLELLRALGVPDVALAFEEGRP